MERAVLRLCCMQLLLSTVLDTLTAKSPVRLYRYRPCHPNNYLDVQITFLASSIVRHLLECATTCNRCLGKFASSGNGFWLEVLEEHLRIRAVGGLSQEDIDADRISVRQLRSVVDRAVQCPQACGRYG